MVAKSFLIVSGEVDQVESAHTLIISPVLVFSRPKHCAILALAKIH
jgi:hypothetical protein